jgi:hypothetical protein
MDILRPTGAHTAPLVAVSVFLRVLKKVGSGFLGYRDVCDD